MPVSGLSIPGIITTHFTRDNILNGGGFGIEGGILTTLVTLLSFLFVRRCVQEQHLQFYEYGLDQIQCLKSTHSRENQFSQPWVHFCIMESVFSFC